MKDITEVKIKTELRSTGKSWLLQNIVLENLKQKPDVHFAIIEMTEENVFHRMYKFLRKGDKNYE